MIDIDFLYKCGMISNLDYYFSRVLCATAKEKDPVVLLSLALVSWTTLNGNVCLDIDEYAGKALYDCGFPDSELFDSPFFLFPVRNQWVQSIEQSGVIGPSIEFPVVYDGKSRLYLAKYYDFQQRIVGSIAKRVREKPDDVDIIVVNRKLDRLFSGIDDLFSKKSRSASAVCSTGVYPKDPDNARKEGIKMQKKAVINAVMSRFSIISGGPGTGKTFICEKIMEFLKNQVGSVSASSLRIIAAAPTGKASSKLNMGSTIHRMLGATNRAGRFRYNKDNPIPCDVAIIDEASMIDIALMARLFEAVPESARLIMLGDKNQLASVEAGAVFGDICRADAMSHVMTDLNYNFRSGSDSGIDRLAKAVNAGDARGVERILLDKRYEDACFVEMGGKDQGLPVKIIDEIAEGYFSFAKESDPAKLLDKFDMFRILCAHKKGYCGTEYFNEIAEKTVFIHKGRNLYPGNFYKKPLMVNVNDYRKNLFNGDTGIAVKSEDGVTGVFFRETGKTRIKTEGEKNKNYEKNDSDTGKEQKPVLRYFPLSDIPPYEDAFAMTVHKSQGSEFDHVLFVIPEKLSPVITRELLYTGITRAKKKVTVAGSMEVIRKAVSIPVRRNSAITELLDSSLDLH